MRTQAQGLRSLGRGQSGPRRLHQPPGKWPRASLQTQGLAREQALRLVPAALPGGSPRPYGSQSRPGLFPGWPTVPCGMGGRFWGETWRVLLSLSRGSPAHPPVHLPRAHTLPDVGCTPAAKAKRFLCGQQPDGVNASHSQLEARPEATVSSARESEVHGTQACPARDSLTRPRRTLWLPEHRAGAEAGRHRAVGEQGLGAPWCRVHRSAEVCSTWWGPCGLRRVSSVPRGGRWACRRHPGEFLPRFPPCPGMTEPVSPRRGRHWVATLNSRLRAASTAAVGNSTRKRGLLGHGPDTAGGLTRMDWQLGPRPADRLRAAWRREPPVRHLRGAATAGRGRAAGASLGGERSRRCNGSRKEREREKRET